MTSKSLLSQGLVILIFLIGCGPEEKGLSPEEKRFVDSLYSNQLVTIRQELDSICKIHQDTIFKLAVDSIKKVRLKEIEELMKH
jgi:hypothetical protein